MYEIFLFINLLIGKKGGGIFVFFYPLYPTIYLFPLNICHNANDLLTKNLAISALLIPDLHITAIGFSLLSSSTVILHHSLE